MPPSIIYVIIYNFVMFNFSHPLVSPSIITSSPKITSSSSNGLLSTLFRSKSAASKKANSPDLVGPEVVL